MLNNMPFYNHHIKSAIIAFGRLFSDIIIIRENPKDSSKNQTIRVPISYAPKEKWLLRIESDPNLTNHTYTVLPTMSFDIQGFSYDQTRKLNRMNRVTASRTPDIQSIKTGVPYNLEISLYIVTKTQEDNCQIMEQILPVFTPEYTVKYTNVASSNIVEDLPIILNSVTLEDNYDGDFKERRFITTTMTFTLKINLYGASVIDNMITNVNMNVGNPNMNPFANFISDGTTDVWTELFK